MAAHRIAVPVIRSEIRCVCGWATRLLVGWGFWTGWNELLDRYNEHRRAERAKRYPRLERGADPDAEA